MDPKNGVWGISARNREQNFALNLLMNPDIDFITLLGQAGTGKTLLTLAAGLTQVLETKLYTEIIMTRVTVPVGEDIGFLPGTEEEKMTPKQMKTLITRAGPGTKVVCPGNISQIDTPYLTEGSSGLTYVVDRMKGWAHCGHITLARGERSRLADYAAEAL